MLVPATIPAAPPPLVRTVVVGHSARGRAIRAVELRAGNAKRTVLVVGCIHGNEAAGMKVVALLRRRPIAGVDLWLLPVLNPDGLAAGTRGNGRRGRPEPELPVAVEADRPARVAAVLGAAAALRAGDARRPRA